MLASLESYSGFSPDLAPSDVSQEEVMRELDGGVELGRLKVGFESLLGDRGTTVSSFVRLSVPTREEVASRRNFDLTPEKKNEHV